MQKFRIQKNNIYKNQHGGDKTCDINTFPSLPSIVEDPSIERIISIGDIHGDLDLAIRYLEIPNLIKRVYKETDMTASLFYKDEPIKRIYEWIGKNTVAVQVGDQVDRCRPYGHECYMKDTTKEDESSDLTIMFFYHDLHTVAIKTGCALYSLLGNHEILNVIGNMDYVSHKGLLEFGTGIKPRIEAFKINSTLKLYNDTYTIAEFLACSRLTSIIINGYLFVHAGLMNKLIESYNDNNGNIKLRDKVIPSINDIIKNWLLNNEDISSGILNNLILGQRLSPFWPRIFGTLKPNLDLSNNDCINHVVPILNKLDIKGMIVGHTPQIGKTINSTCSDTIWRVDIGSSHAFDDVIFDGINNNKLKSTIQKSRTPHVLEITLGDKDTYKLLGL